MLPPTPFCTSFSFLHISAFSLSLLLLFQLLSLSSLWFSIFSLSFFLPFSHPPAASSNLLTFSASTFHGSLLFTISTSQYLSLPRTIFPTFFSALQFCHTFSTPDVFPPSLFFSPRFLTQLPFSFLFRTNFSCHLFLLFFSASAISLSHTFIPFPCLNFFHILPHFPSPRRFSLPSYLRPSCLPSFYALRTGEEIQKYNFYCTIKTFSLDYFAVHGIFSLPASIWSDTGPSAARFKPV